MMSTKFIFCLLVLITICDGAPQPDSEIGVENQNIYVTKDQLESLISAYNAAVKENNGKPEDQEKFAAAAAAQGNSIATPSLSGK